MNRAKLTRHAAWLLLALCILLLPPLLSPMPEAPAQAAGTWHTELIGPTASYRTADIALNGSDVPHISYQDPTNAPYHDLRFARKQGNTWENEIVTWGTYVGWPSDIDIAPDGKFRIVYGAEDAIESAWRVTDTWNLEGVDGGAWLGYISMDLDSSAQPHISYADWDNRKLHYAFYDSESEKWKPEIVADGDMDETSLLWSGGTVHIAFRHDGTVKYAHGSSGSWQIESVGPGGDVSLALNGTQPVILYYHDQALHYATRGSGGWSSEVVDSAGGAGAVVVRTGKPHVVYRGSTGLRYATRVAGGWRSEEINSDIASYIALTLDSGGQPHFVYNKGTDLYYGWGAPEPPPPPTYDLSIDKVEITQGIQCFDTTQGETTCADNSVPLVRGKSTIIRLFPRVDLLPDKVLPADLVTAVLVLDSAPGGTLQPLNGPIPLKLTPDRTQVNDSLNFRLPVDWTTAAEVRFHLIINPERTLNETNYDNNRYDRSATLQERGDLSILSLPIRYAPPGQAALEPSARVQRAHLLTVKLYPVRAGGVRYIPGKTLTYRQPLVAWPDTVRFMGWLNRLYAVPYLLGASQAPDQMVAWLPPIPGYTLLGLSDPLWATPAGQARVTLAQDTVDGAMTLAHEMGHNLGRRHPNTADGCNAVDPGTDWPYTTATIQEVGFDPFANNGRGATQNPANRFDVMSYCSPPVEQIWISPFTYRSLFAANSQPQRQAAEQPSQGTQEYLLVSGSITRAGVATLDDLWRVQSSAPIPASSTGDYCVLLQGSSNQELGRHCFDLDFIDHYGNAVDMEGFFLIVPFASGTQRVAVRHQTTQLLAHTASAHAPVVAITEPAPGASWSGTRTIRWTASDADGDSLTFNLYYSPDGGLTWLPLDAELSGTSTTVDTAEIPGGSQARIRLLASDGFHTGSAEVGPFTVARHAPRVVLLTPEDGSWVEPGQPLLLLGEGYDLEDGPLADSALSWSASPGGALGSGSEKMLTAPQEGDLIVTLTGRDSEGQSTTATFTFHVGTSNLSIYLPLLRR